MSALPGRPQAKHARPMPEADLDWQRGARCVDIDPELFHPTKGRSGNQSGRNIIPAVAICRRCDVRLQCLQYALTHTDGKYGIWGGTTEGERKELRKTIQARKRRRVA